MLVRCCGDGLGNRRVTISRIAALVGILALVAGCKPGQELLVDVAVIDPTIVIEMRYASTENLAKRDFYGVNRCYLRRSVAQRLVLVQEELRAQGFGLKVWDAYRPMSVQKALWRAVPDQRYVSRPGPLACHPRGAAVDVTLVDSEGRELEMPTGFDEASPAASPTSGLGTEAARRNVLILQRAMRGAGFQPFKLEWWHFNDRAWRRFPALDIPVKDVEQYFDLYREGRGK